jgi:hypothetical protein
MILWRNHCYKAVVNTELAWYDAQKSCATVYQGNLASVHSTEENELLKNLMIDGTYAFWFGLTDLNRARGGFYYTDGTSFVYKNWRLNQPELNDPERCATVFKDGFWHDSTCSTQLNYACKAKLLTQSISVTGTGSVE